jgi:histidinol phosphatase-like PHP family hydrolase
MEVRRGSIVGARSPACIGKRPDGIGAEAKLMKSANRTPVTDVNAVAGGLLRDLALVQTSPQKAFGYKRAAAAILALERPLDTLVEPDGRLAKIAGIGPASTRVIREVLASGTSAIVNDAVVASGRAPEIERRRALRAHFLSRAEVLRILREPSLGGPHPQAYRGDLQMHSSWSDGVPSLADIADACIARGYAYAAVTDHSHGLKIAGGMSASEAAEQQAAIRQLNEALGTRFRLIAGIEANIAGDGQLDLSDEEAASFELVLAAPHSRLRAADDQTARLLRAIRHPAVRILAHPRGRIAGVRAGLIADWAAVFGAAAEQRVAVEIDGDPARQDLDYTLAGQARDAGCLFALDSDAHTTSQLQYADTALAHARLAAIPADRIVNCWPLERLLAWACDRHAA